MRNITVKGGGNSYTVCNLNLNLRSSDGTLYLNGEVPVMNGEAYPDLKFVWKLNEAGGLLPKDIVALIKQTGAPIHSFTKRDGSTMLSVRKPFICDNQIAERVEKADFGKACTNVQHTPLLDAVRELLKEFIGDPELSKTTQAKVDQEGSTDFGDYATELPAGSGEQPPF